MRLMTRFAALLLLLPAAPAGGAEQDMVMQAMEDELARSMESLRMENLDKPYFIAYRIDDGATTTVQAIFGSLVDSSQTKERELTVEVRVGEPSLDNTNFFTVSGGRGYIMMRGGGEQLPLEDNVQEIRRKLWLATDAAFKEALEDLSRKRAALQNKTRTEELPDFAAQDPAKVFDPAAPPPPDLAQVAELARGLSQLFRSMPQIASSSVRLECQTLYTRYANSEGSRFKRATPEVRFVATARGYAPDGLPLMDFAAAYGRSLSDLPPRDQLAVGIEAMGQRLAAAQKGTLLDTYNGPVLVEGEAAAELLSQAFLPSLAGWRKPVTDNPQLDMFLQRQPATLADKIGARVLPTFLKVEDDPTLPRQGSTALMGAYSVDDDGVPAAKTVLVENGILKTLLGTRNPARGAMKSTGNRRGEGAVPTNVIITAKGGMKEKDLRQKLLSLVKERGLEYGIAVRRLSDPLLTPAEASPRASIMRLMGGGGEENKLAPTIAAYKIYPNGREELVRNAEVSDIGAASFKDILAASQAQAVVTLPYSGGGGISASAGRMAAMFGGAESTAPLVTLVTPSLLFEELTLKKPSEEVPKPPVAGHPFFAK